MIADVILSAPVPSPSDGVAIFRPHIEFSLIQKAPKINTLHKNRHFFKKSVKRSGSRWQLVCEETGCMTVFDKGECHVFFRFHLTKWFWHNVCAANLWGWRIHSGTVQTAPYAVFHRGWSGDSTKNRLWVRGVECMHGKALVGGVAGDRGPPFRWAPMCTSQKQRAGSLSLPL